MRGPLNSSYEIGGGVLIAVRSNLTSEVVVVPGIDMVEMVVVLCTYHKRKVYFCCLYIPSRSCAAVYQSYTTAVECVLDHIGIADEDTVFVLGDFNIPSCEWLSDPDHTRAFLPSNVGRPFACCDGRWFVTNESRD